MFAIAYRMLGSVGDAEDIVQEAFLRYHQAVSRGTTVESPKAFLATVTTRLSIDSLRSARARRESYLGPWLPEPLLASPAAAADPAVAAAIEADPARQAAEADSLSMAFLLLLERLNPVERAVFLLRDVFGYEYGEVAGIVGKSESNCRQLAVRARRHVSENKPRFEVSRSRREALARRFFDALGGGDLDGLAGVLADDVVVFGDGGGTSPSWPRPIAGVERVSRLLVGLARQIGEGGARLAQVPVNGQPGAVVLDSGGAVVSVLCLEIAAGRVQTIRSVINPAKLGHLGRLSTFREDAKGSAPGGEPSRS
jgi:RNA polymerase sigma-70 factor (ECF subfamily)